MSELPIGGREGDHTARWDEWQLANAKGSRRAAIQARVAFAILLTGTVAWLGLQFLSMPA
jgi:hypothetical protein